MDPGLSSGHTDPNDFLKVLQILNSCIITAGSFTAQEEIKVGNECMVYPGECDIIGPVTESDKVLSMLLRGEIALIGIGRKVCAQQRLNTFIVIFEDGDYCAFLFTLSSKEYVHEVLKCGRLILVLKMQFGLDNLIAERVQVMVDNPGFFGVSFDPHGFFVPFLGGYEFSG